jgi:hypothetical protein
LALQIIIILAPWCAIAVIALWLHRLAGDVSRMRHERTDLQQLSANVESLLELTRRQDEGDSRESVAGKIGEATTKEP